MTDEALDLAAATAILGSRWLRLVPSPPLTRANHPPESEPNTYGLPEGKGLARALRGWYQKLRRAVLAAIPHDGPLPTGFPSLTGAHWRDPMVAEMTPLVAAIYGKAGRAAAARLAVDHGHGHGHGRSTPGPDEGTIATAFDVTNPNLRHQISKLTLNFVQSTLASTSRRTDDALEALRHELDTGMTSGETLKELKDRVNAIFDGLTGSHARTIAATEASRATHAAQNQAAIESGVVAGFEMLVSSDACDLCQMVASECNKVMLGQAFAIIGSHPDYSMISFPPIHPNCACTIIDVLTPEYGGPVDPEWGQTLIQPQNSIPPGGYVPPKGVPLAQPNPKLAANPPVPVVPQPAPFLPPIPIPVPTPEPEPVPQPMPQPTPTPTPNLPAIDEAVAYAKARGITVGTDGAAALVKEYGASKAARIPAYYHSGTKTITINAGQEYWRNPAKFMADAAKSRWFSSANPDHIIVHEVGHAEHNRSAGQAKYDAARKAKFTPEQAKMVKKYVSRYGATQPIEFVAETYAGLAAGKAYNAEVMALYKSFHGPIP